MTNRQQDSKADGHTIKGHQLSQSTGKSTPLDVARRVVNRGMNSHQLIICIITIVKDKDKCMV